MAKSYKVSAPEGTVLEAVQYISLPDSKLADVWMRKDIQEETVTCETTSPQDGETQYVTYKEETAEELYFQVDTSKVSEEDIKANFDKYWVFGEKWRNENAITDKEKIAELQAENVELKQYIIELSGLL